MSARIWVGGYRELCHARSELPSMVDSFVAAPYEHQDDIAEALAVGGETVMTMCGRAHDVFTGEPIGRSEIRHSDRFSRSTNLAHYVVAYNLVPDPRFVEYVVSGEWMRERLERTKAEMKRRQLERHRNAACE